MENPAHFLKNIIARKENLGDRGSSMTSVNGYLQALLISLLAVEIAIAIAINDEFDGTGKSQDRRNSWNRDGDGVYFVLHYNL